MGWGYFGPIIAGSLPSAIIDIHPDRGELTDLARPSLGWIYQTRNAKVTAPPHFEGWPIASGFVCGEISGLALIEGFSDWSSNPYPWEPWELGVSGCVRPRYLYGSALNASAVAVAGANVDCFVTATDIRDSNSVTDTNGNWQAPCFTPSVAHYVVIYKTGSPDIAGVSVNTLTPTL